VSDLKFGARKRGRGKGSEGEGFVLDWGICKMLFLISNTDISSRFNWIK
jgi:hypothetical protein